MTCDTARVYPGLLASHSARPPDNTCIYIYKYVSGKMKFSTRTPIRPSPTSRRTLSSVVYALTCVSACVCTYAVRRRTARASRTPSFATLKPTLNPGHVSRCERTVCDIHTYVRTYTASAPFRTSPAPAYNTSARARKSISEPFARTVSRARLTGCCCTRAERRE